MAYFPRFIGGAEVALKEITDRLAGDFEFHMVTLRYDSNLPRVSQEGQVLVHRIGPSLKNPSLADLRRVPLRFLKLWFQIAAFFAARSLHKKYHYDGLWAMMAHSSGVPAALFKKVFPHVPYLLTLQEGDPPQKIERQMRLFGGWFRAAFTRADRVQAISTFLAGWAERMGSHNVVVIPNGVDVKRFSQKVASEERSRIRAQAHASDTDTLLITVSRLVPKNGVDTVIEALALVEESVKFIVVGEGPEREKLEALAREKKVNTRVTFIGEASQAEIPALLSASDIFIRASRSEGQGIAFIEAMAAGLPTVGTPVGGIPDFLTHGKTGFLAPAEMPKNVASAIELAMGESARTVADAGRKLVEAEYEWDTIAGRMKNLFESLWKK